VAPVVPKGDDSFAPVTPMGSAPVAPMGSRGWRAAGRCSAVRSSECASEKTRGRGSKSQAQQTRLASKEKRDTGRQEWASLSRQA
jgi:hypothetical protein